MLRKESTRNTGSSKGLGSLISPLKRKILRATTGVKNLKDDKLK
jgi:hypothetical protein